jgi:hypothetical protein
MEQFAVPLQNWARTMPCQHGVLFPLGLEPTFAGEQEMQQPLETVLKG